MIAVLLSNQKIKEDKDKSFHVRGAISGDRNSLLAKMKTLNIGKEEQDGKTITTINAKSN